MVLIPPAAHWPNTSSGCSGETQCPGRSWGPAVIDALCPAHTHLPVAWRGTRGVGINCMAGINYVGTGGHSYIEGRFHVLVQSCLSVRPEPVGRTLSECFLRPVPVLALACTPPFRSSISLLALLAESIPSPVTLRCVHHYRPSPSHHPPWTPVSEFVSGPVHSRPRYSLF